MTADADLLVVAGRVLTFHRGRAEALPRGMVLGRGRILEIVEPDDLAARARAGTPVLDLSAATVIPGLFDAHNHQPSAARDLLDVLTAHVRDLDGLIDTLAQHARGPEGAWIATERNLTRSQLGVARLPTAVELDAASTTHPIAVRFGAHTMALNTRALRDSGLHALGADPAQGRLERDPAGRPLGPIYEYGALRHVEERLSSPSPERLVESLAGVQRRYAEAGITAVRVPGVRPGEFGLYQSLREREGGLRNRVFGAVRIDPNLSQTEKLDYIAGWQVRTGFGDDWLRLDALKLFVDGGLEATADGPGDFFLDRDELVTVVRFAVARGWSVTCHAITRAAVDLVLGAYERAAPVAPGRPTLAIEHGLFMKRAQLEWAAAQRVWLSTQPGLLEIDARVTDRVGGGACPLRSALAAGVRCALGSDWNATPGTQRRPFAPLRTIRSAVRSAHDGTCPDETIPAATALYLHTRAPAELVGAADLGGIWPGAAADLVALPGHLDAEDLADAAEATPTAVLVGGRQVLAPGSPA